jgi:hypothetical protein
MDSAYSAVATAKSESPSLARKSPSLSFAGDTGSSLLDALKAAKQQLKGGKSSAA